MDSNALVSREPTNSFTPVAGPKPSKLVVKVRLTGSSRLEEPHQLEVQKKHVTQ